MDETMVEINTSSARHCQFIRQSLAAPYGTPLGNP
jgi:hypothetical protein